MDLYTWLAWQWRQMSRDSWVWNCWACAREECSQWTGALAGILELFEWNIWVWKQIMFLKETSTLKANGRLIVGNTVLFRISVETEPSDEASVSGKTGLSISPAPPSWIHDVTWLPNPPQEKRWWLYILPQYLANQTKPTGHIERYGFTAVVPTLTALPLSSFNDLQFFFVFLYAI